MDGLTLSLISLAVSILAWGSLIIHNEIILRRMERDLREKRAAAIKEIEADHKALMDEFNEAWKQIHA